MRRFGKDRSRCATLVKDNYDVVGLQTTGGSAALLGWVGRRAGRTTSIPCSPVLRAISTTPPTRLGDLQVARGRGSPRASVSWASAPTLLARSGILPPTMLLLGCAQVGRRSA